MTGTPKRRAWIAACLAALMGMTFLAPAAVAQDDPEQDDPEQDDPEQDDPE